MIHVLQTSTIHGSKTENLPPLFSAYSFHLSLWCLSRLLPKQRLDRNAYNTINFVLKVSSFIHLLNIWLTRSKTTRYNRRLPFGGRGYGVIGYPIDAMNVSRTCSLGSNTECNDLSLLATLSPRSSVDDFHRCAVYLGHRVLLDAHSSQ
jgi:hypothetical protein